MKKVVFFLLIISNSLLLSMEPQRHISELAATEVMPLKYLAGKVVAKAMKDPSFRATVSTLDATRKALISRAVIEENPIRLFEIFRPYCNPPFEFRDLEQWFNMLEVVKFSPNGKHLVISKKDGSIVILTWIGQERFRCPLKENTACAIAITFSEDSKLVLAASKDYKVRIWSIENPFLPPETIDCSEIVRELGLTGVMFPCHIAVSPDKNYIAVLFDLGSKGCLISRKYQTKIPLVLKGCHYNVVFDPASSYFISSDGVFGFNTYVLKKGRVKTIKGYGVTPSEYIRGNPHHSQSQSHSFSIISRNGKYLLLWGVDDYSASKCFNTVYRLSLWNIEDISEPHLIEYKEVDEGIVSVSLHNDGTYKLLTGITNHFRKLSSILGISEKKVHENEESSYKLKYSPLTGVLVSERWDTCKLWELFALADKHDPEFLYSINEAITTKDLSKLEVTLSQLKDQVLAQRIRKYVSLAPAGYLEQITNILGEWASFIKR